jgi:pimeloyl-ACP methyl ester carboxylesterase
MVISELSDLALDDRGRLVPALPDGSPAWMATAFAHAPRTWRTHVEGSGIEVLEWGPLDGSAVLLLHGQAAHADWWRFIAPYLAEGRRVIVPSLSGMGGSDWRESYDIPLYAREIQAVLQAAGLDGASARVTLVGHSFGCIVLLQAARELGATVASLMLIDFYIAPPSVTPRSAPVRKVRRYDDREAALARFRLSPQQTCDNPALLRYIANRTLRYVTDLPPYWSWVSDPRTLQPTDHDITRRNLAAVLVPLTILRGGRSALMDEDVLAHVRSLAPGARYVEIPDADHHVLIDQPLATVAALRALLAADGL